MNLEGANSGGLGTEVPQLGPGVGFVPQKLTTFRS